MRLRTLTYRENEGTPKAWAMEGLLLRDLNLVVGRNATGKSRTVGAIDKLAQLLAGRIKPEAVGSVSFDADFEHGSGQVGYVLEISDGRVIEERYVVDSKVLLERSKSGDDRIWAEQLGKDIGFQVPESELALVMRQDSIQHPGLAAAHSWAQTVLRYDFGTSFGKQNLLQIGDLLDIRFNPYDRERPVATYLAGVMRDAKGLTSKSTEEFHAWMQRHKQDPRSFPSLVLADMKRVGYDLEAIETAGRPGAKAAMSWGPNLGFVLNVKERGLPHHTDQFEMSQGMFRVLALLIHVNLAILETKPACILVDDIGEGLDFERSCQLIEVLKEKAKSTSVQMVMATNDRFVMNRVPLEDWTVLTRRPGGVRIRNYANSKQQFDDFRFTGMNNFDLLATNFLEEADDSAAAPSDA